MRFTSIVVLLTPLVIVPLEAASISRIRGLGIGLEPTDTPSESPTKSPTTSPVKPPTDVGFVCPICGEGNVITIPDGIVDAGSLGTFTCLEVVAAANAGMFTEAQCVLIQPVAAENCGCEPEGGGPSPTAEPTEEGVEPTSAPATAQPTPCSTLPEIICDLASFSTLCELVGIFELVDALSVGTWTIFAPTNDAFSGIADVVANLGPEEILDILLFHAVNGTALTISDLECGGFVTMLNGMTSQTVCDEEDGAIFQVGAGNTPAMLPEIILPDVFACNGVIQGVDNVLLPGEDAPMEPSDTPTKSPTKSPTAAPVESPTDAPTKSPTKSPTAAPAASPTDAPTKSPTKSPTAAPALTPTDTPTKAPTISPTAAPVESPTNPPTRTPTAAPVESPTNPPTRTPTAAPVESPTNPPTRTPTAAPMESPTNAPNATFVCPICGEGNEVTNPNGIVDAGGLGTFTCLEVVAAANAGLITEAQCVLIQPVAAENCGCEPEGGGPSPTAAPVFTAPPTPCSTIPEIACNLPSFSALCELVGVFELGDVLSSGTWTIFAPTNDAFSAIADVAATLAPEELLDILLFHAVNGTALSTSDLECEGFITMVNGVDSQTVCDEDGNIFQVGAGNSEDMLPQIILPDVPACNGIIHAVDNVMLPGADVPDGPTATPGSPVLVEVNIVFDGFPPETGWAITDSSGATVASLPVGTYPPGTASTSEEVELIAGSQYTFTISDLFGDGMSNPMDGTYEVTQGDTVLVSGGGNFGREESTDFTPL